MQNLITEAAVDERPLPNPSQQISDLGLKLRNQFIDQQLASLIQRAAQPNIPEADRIELLRHQQQLRSQKRLPLSPLQAKA
jgi:hypothetical protein